MLKDEPIYPGKVFFVGSEYAVSEELIGWVSDDPVIYACMDGYCGA